MKTYSAETIAAYGQVIESGGPGAASEYAPSGATLSNALWHLAMMVHCDLVGAPRKVQERIFAWVIDTFGPEHAINVPERSLRHAEEALELAQACGVDRETAHKLVDYVFDRPAGKIGQEVAGSLVTLYAAASAASIDADEEFEKELQRVTQPEVVERCRRRQSEKREALGHPRASGRLGPCAVCGEVDEHVIHHTSAPLPSGREPHAFVAK